MLDEQRRTIIAEYGEKILHHELLAAQAEQNRRILQEELLQQQQDFREVHQQDLLKMKELQKFQNSTFDEFTQQIFPRHPPFEGLLKPAFISQRQTEEPPNIRDTSGISGNVFCTSTDLFISSVFSRFKFYLEENY